MTEILASWHHYLVHFAVALTITSVAFDVLDFFLHRPQFEQTGFLLMAPAVVFLLAAVLTGNLAESFVGTAGLQTTIEQHRTYANIAVWVFCAAGLWRVFLHVQRRYSGIRKVIYVFLVTAAAASTFLAGLKGGQIRHSDFPKGDRTVAGQFQFLSERPS